MKRFLKLIVCVLFSYSSYAQIDSVAFSLPSFDSVDVQIPQIDTVATQVSIYNSLIDTTSQKDSIRKIIIKPTLEYGVGFIQNSMLRELYNTNTVWYGSIGMQLKQNDSSAFYPYINFSQVSYSITNSFDSIQLTFNSQTLRIRQIHVGFIVHLLEYNSSTFFGNVSYTQGIANESFYDIHTPMYGLGFGLGMQRKFIKKSSYYITYVYNFQKTKVLHFRDFDIVRLSIGICL